MPMNHVDRFVGKSTGKQYQEMKQVNGVIRIRSLDHVVMLRLLAVVLLLVAVSLAHWLTPRGDYVFQGLHVAMRKGFVFPIILAAVWFNLRGAILTATVATVIYLPHMLLQWRGDVGQNLNQAGEVLTMWGVAVLAGWFIGREKSVLQRVVQTHWGTLSALVGTLDAREHDTELHSIRVQQYALRIGRKMGARSLRVWVGVRIRVRISHRV